MGANDKQVGGNHYKGGMEVWDFIIANNIGYLPGNAIKYLARCERKGAKLQDLEKAKHYVEKAIETEHARLNAEHFEKVKEARDPATSGEIYHGRAVQS